MLIRMAQVTQVGGARPQLRSNILGHSEQPDKRKTVRGVVQGPRSVRRGTAPYEGSRPTYKQARSTSLYKMP